MTDSSGKPHDTAKQFWLIVPAAGVGKRMQADRPKQYLSLQNKTVIEQTLDRVLSIDVIQGAVLSISKGDEYWPSLNYKHHKKIILAQGGKERSDSVFNALLKLKQNVDDARQVWVLVHDAARPCVRTSDIEKLIALASKGEQGGLLAIPVRDTMKRVLVQSDKVEKTVEREGLWHALTPQMFRLDLLIEALQAADKKNLPVTDDASAMEYAGYRPLLVEGHGDNIKITRAFDLQLAALYLSNLK
ncbi:2-C-methyl-D-erythritol 4-phosphate cytidylyltransferase [hydrothermal vent metagenome]|uniref:2-C-methyl-D-erythritol 4-phosphate cytidylyltransferase n=1 Tax=hydrothermal vent metagenome TaxID=652676 RepID=A0A3B0X3T9_9ZZZZ